MGSPRVLDDPILLTARSNICRLAITDDHHPVVNLVFWIRTLEEFFGQNPSRIHLQPACHVHSSTDWLPLELPLQLCVGDSIDLCLSEVVFEMTCHMSAMILSV